MSPRSVQPAWSSQRSATKILPSTVPPTFTDFVLISPRMHACSPIVSVPVESIVPSTSPSISSSFRNLIEPLIETPRERRVPDGVGMNVLLDGPGTTNGSGRFVCGGPVWLRGRKRLKGCTARIVPNHSAFRRRNSSGPSGQIPEGVLYPYARVFFGEVSGLLDGRHTMRLSFPNAARKITNLALRSAKAFSCFFHFFGSHWLVIITTSFVSS
jgi:hypothetical protein